MSSAPKMLSKRSRLRRHPLISVDAGDTIWDAVLQPCLRKAHEAAPPEHIPAPQFFHPAGQRSYIIHGDSW